METPCTPCIGVQASEKEYHEVSLHTAKLYPGTVKLHHEHGIMQARARLEELTAQMQAEGEEIGRAHV